MMYTDGITEATSPEGEEFGYEKLKQIVEKHVHESAKLKYNRLVINGLLEFTQVEDIEDDFTTMILKFS